MIARARASSYLRVLWPLARLDERLDVDAGELQTLARVNKTREFEETAVVAVRVVGVLKKGIAIVCMFARSSNVSYALVRMCADQNRRTFR